LVKPLIAEAAALLLCFARASVRFCRRAANAPADWAAKAQNNGHLPSNWAAFPPPALLHLLACDVCEADCNFRY